MSDVREGSLVDGRYRVGALLGSGGMADVWLAEDAHLPRRVALKVLHRQYARDPEFIERFRREAEAAANLQHPNVVPIFDRGQVDDTYYIAMAYIQGGSLRELIDAGLTPQEAVAIVRQVLEGAGFAHRHGVIHRDLKPLNVIVDPEGTAIVTDFGIARAGASEMTQTGSIMGTAHYLSPEQAEGYDVTPASDLYSVGVILYECLTGRVPFEGETPVAVALKQATEVPPPPSAFNPAVSPALDAVVMRALEKDPADRFQTAEDFVAALDAAEDDPGAPVYVVPEERKAWPWVLAALALLLIGLLVWGLVRGKGTADVPNVTGNQLPVAMTLLEQDGLDVGEIRRVQRQAPPNLVLEQDPVGETERDCSFLSFFCSDPEVDLTVSGGPGRAEVPRVAGLSREEAKETLEDAGFGVAVRRQNSDSVEEDVVISTDPQGGSTVKRGSQVTIVVSAGVRPVSVPPVVGRSLDAARQVLDARGLAYTVTEEASDSRAGNVLSQSPNAGTTVPPGTTVSLVAARAEEEEVVEVPNVVGQERAEAVEAVRALGLVPDVEEEDTDIEPQDGRVTDQFPPPGSEQAPGSTVSITVGRYVAPAAPPDVDTGGEAP